MSIGTFLIKKAIWKGVRRAVQVIVAFLGTGAVKAAGVDINEVALTATLTGLIEAGLNTLKHKWPKLFGWL